VGGIFEVAFLGAISERERKSRSFRKTKTQKMAIMEEKERVRKYLGG
jgi:hypothetical protein